MILQSIEVENFGVFRGKHVFNLKPNFGEKRPIILFGGLNGSGKTTLFDGIKICLYGRTTFKDFRTKKQYNAYLSKKIKPLNSQRRKVYRGAIELNIEFNDFGVKDIYSVRRTWKIDEDDVDESFRVLKNGQVLGDVEQEYSQAFIANLIPMGISDLFFFDGEKIQELAQDTIDNGFFKDALDTILGLDIIQTLKNDLRLYSYKQNASEDTQDIVKMIDEVQKEILSLERVLGDLFQDKASLKTKLEKTIDIIARKENELTLQGAGYARKRFEFKEKLNKIENELEETRKRLKEFYSGLFPFTLVPKLCLQLRNKIQEERTRKNELSALLVLEKKKGDFEARLFEKNGQLTRFSDSSSKRSLVDDIISVLRDVIIDQDERDFIFIEDFSENELNQLLYWVEQTSNTIPREIERLSSKYDKLHADRVHYENLIRRVPDDSILDPIVNEINQQYEMKGRYESQLSKIEEETERLKYKITEAKRQLKTLNEKFEQQNKHERKIQLLRNIRVMLDEYQDNIRESKLEILRNAFLDSITMIIRKHDFISDIKIDSNYHIDLQMADGNYLSKSILSNGEKQIFAISMLLALAKVSGRPLPFVIDTPLARLDSSHRDKIVENFFPNASHQVIIFSTDTEIDKMYFEKLAPHITRVYHLKYDDQTKSSLASEGYFWETMEVTHD